MTQATKLNFGRDVQGFNAFSPPPPNNIFSAKLTVGVPATITLPLEYKHWILGFSYTGGSEVWVDFSGATAANPTLGTFGATTSSRNPGTRIVKSTKSDNTTAATISLITPDATAYVSVELWGIE